MKSSFPSQELNLDNLDENQESATRLARPRGRSYFFPLSLSLVKNVFIMGEETVNVGTKFIIRDVSQQVGEHTEKWFV